MKRDFTILVLLLFLVGHVSAQKNFDLLYNQPIYDGGSAPNSSFDPSAELDFEVADNFSGLEEEIEEIVFYGLAMKYIDDAWEEQIPGDTEPFFLSFYEYNVGITPHLQAPVSGTYQIALLDDFGDGWAGDYPVSGDLYHSVSVFVNGSPVLENLTLLDGAGPEYHQFEATAGDYITTTFTVDGSFAGECYYAILDPLESIIAEDGGTWDNLGASTPLGIAPGGEPMVLEPEWESPISSHNVTASVVNVGSIWENARQLYKFTVLPDSPINIDEGWMSLQIDSENGSGTWFLWLNSLDGDLLSWQRIPDDKASYNKKIAAAKTASAPGVKSSTRDLNSYDLALELWGGELASPPECVLYLSPANEAINVNKNVSLTWQSNPLATGYELFLGEVLPETGIDLGNVTSYQTDLVYSTTYQWKVVPYNSSGAAEGCEAWSFTTLDDPTQTLPWAEDFTGIESGQIPLGWDKSHPNWGVAETSNASGESPEMKFDYSPSATATFKLISPPLDATAKTDYRLAFKHFLDYYDEGATYKVQTSADGESWADIWTLVDPTDNVGPETVTINLGNMLDVQYIAWVYEGNSFNTDGWYIDDIVVEEMPIVPVFSIDPDPLDGELDFGNIPVGEQSDAQSFTIQNTGIGNLIIERIMLDGGDAGEFILTDAPEEDVILLAGETYSFNVSFAPASAAMMETTLYVFYADGQPDQTYSLTLIGTGIEPPAGSTCGNPYLVTLPVIDYEDNTEAYGDYYSSTWVDPETSYLNGNDFVAQFTLSEQGYLSGSVEGSWTGVIIVEDCPDPDTPAAVLAKGTGSTGGSFADVVFQPGTYFAIVSTYPSPQFIDFTLNLSFEPLPDCVAPDDLTATDITTTSATLGWTPIGSETSWNIEWGLSGFEQGEGTLAEGVDNPYALAGLDPATTYDFYVQSICNGETSEWTGPETFTTQLIAPVPWFEGFSTTTTPQGWTATGWSIGTTTAIPPVDDNYIRRNLWSSTPTSTFSTLNAGPVEQEMVLTFDYALANYNSPYNPPASGSGDFVVSISTDFGSTYIEQEVIENDGVEGWKTFSLDLDDFVGEIIKIRIVANWNSGDYWIAFDNFFIGIPGAEGITLDLKVILEGAYSPGKSELMHTQINEVLPLTQPYNVDLPFFGITPLWYYEGTESIDEIPEEMVDWVLVELRDAPSAAQAFNNTVLARQAALLLNTGQIVGTDGQLLVFDVEITENLFVVVYHRNHLSVMSAEALTETEGVYGWDFTQDAKRAFSIYEKSSYQNGHKELEEGIYGMYGGDGDGNGQIQLQDKNNVWESESLTSGYKAGDYDLNGEVQTQDKNNIWQPNSLIGSQVPGNPK